MPLGILVKRKKIKSKATLEFIQGIESDLAELSDILRVDLQIGTIEKRK